MGNFERDPVLGVHTACTGAGYAEGDFASTRLTIPTEDTLELDYALRVSRTVVSEPQPPLASVLPQCVRQLHATLSALQWTCCACPFSSVGRAGDS